MGEENNNTHKNHEGMSFERLKQKGVNKNKESGILRATSDNLTETISKMPNLKKGNVVIIDGIKYHFNGKDKFIIDKNAKKSAELQGKDYKEVVVTRELKGKPYAPEYVHQVEEVDKMGNEKVERRIGLQITLEEYGKKVGEIKWTEELKRKLDQLEGKPYAPKYVHQVEEVDKMGNEEVERRIELAIKLEEYGIKVGGDFHYFRELGEIKWTEELKRKLDQLKGKPYAPEYVFQVEKVDKMGNEEVKKRIGLAITLEEYGIKVGDSFRELGEIKWTEELKSKLDQLKGKPYAPEYVHQVEEVDKMGNEEVKKRIGLAITLEEYGIKVGDFHSFRELGEIKWTEELKRKLDQLEGKPYAPKYVFQVLNLQKTL